MSIYILSVLIIVSCIIIFDHYCDWANPFLTVHPLLMTSYRPRCIEHHALEKLNFAVEHLHGQRILYNKI